MVWSVGNRTNAHQHQSLDLHRVNTIRIIIKCSDFKFKNRRNERKNIFWGLIEERGKKGERRGKVGKKGRGKGKGFGALKLGVLLKFYLKYKAKIYFYFFLRFIKNL